LGETSLRERPAAMTQSQRSLSSPKSLRAVYEPPYQIASKFREMMSDWCDTTRPGRTNVTTNGPTLERDQNDRLWRPIHLLPTFVRDRSGDLREIRSNSRFAAASDMLAEPGCVHRSDAGGCGISNQEAKRPRSIGFRKREAAQIFAASRFEISLCRGTASNRASRGIAP